VLGWQAAWIAKASGAVRQSHESQPHLWQVTLHLRLSLASGIMAVFTQ
jgi:hypothetical protein